MKHLKLYEEFIETNISTNKNNADFILTPELIKNYENEDTFVDANGVIHIKNWKTY